MVRIPVSNFIHEDPRTWAKQDYHRKRFHEQLSSAQREFIQKIFSWYIDFSTSGKPVLELTVLNEKQATVARMMF